MTEGLAQIISTGAAGAVIGVVLIFLKFIKERDTEWIKRDQEWRSFFSSMRATDSDATTRLTAAITELTERIEELKNRFEQHDATEMEFLRQVVGRMDARKETPTQPRTRRGRTEG